MLPLPIERFCERDETGQIVDAELLPGGMDEGITDFPVDSDVRIRGGNSRKESFDSGVFWDRDGILGLVETGRVVVDVGHGNHDVRLAIPTAAVLHFRDQRKRVLEKRINGISISVTIHRII